MEGTRNAVTAEHIIQISKLYKVTTDFLLTGNKNSIQMTPKNGFLPLIDAKAHAKFIENANKGDVLNDYEYYKIPGFNPTKESVLFEIEGESMQPTILPGDALVCQTQKKMDYVVEGSVVVVMTKGESFDTRNHKDSDADYFIVEGDNPECESKRRIKKSDITNF